MQGRCSSYTDAPAAAGEDAVPSATEASGLYCLNAHTPGVRADDHSSSRRPRRPRGALGAGKGRRGAGALHGLHRRLQDRGAGRKPHGEVRGPAHAHELGDAQRPVLRVSSDDDAARGCRDLSASHQRLRRAAARADAERDHGAPGPARRSGDAGVLRQLDEADADGGPAVQRRVDRRAAGGDPEGVRPQVRGARGGVPGRRPGAREEVPGRQPRVRRPPRPQRVRPGRAQSRTPCSPFT